MMELIKTLIAGIKQGTIAAWYDLKEYIIVMGAILILYLAYSYIRAYISKK